MARLRTANPSAPTDEDVATMSIWARYVWAYLPCHADLDGRLLDKPFSLKLDLLPTDDVDMGAILDELAARRHIIRYRVGGRAYIQVRSFAKHQRPHKNEKSRGYPSPPVGEGETNSGQNTSGTGEKASEPLRDQGSGILGSGEASPAPAIPGATEWSPPDIYDPLRPEKIFAHSMARGEEITPHFLGRMFGLVRQSEIKGAIEWVVPRGVEKSQAVADACERSPEIKADLIPTMRLIFAQAKAGIGDRATDVIQNPSFAFGCWCSTLTKLQEAVHGVSPKAPAARAGPRTDIRVGHARAETARHQGGERKL